MPVVNVDYLSDLGQEVLDGVVQALSDNGIDIPARRYLAPGSDAVDDVGEDCNGALTVRFLRMFSGFPGAELSDLEQAGYVRTAEYMIRLVRCIWTDEAEGPTPAEQGDDMVIAARDAWCIFQGLLELAGAGSFLESCQTWAIGNVVSVGPDGGLAGIELPLQIQVTG